MTKLLFLPVFTFMIVSGKAQVITGNAIPSVQFADVNGRIIPAGVNGVQGNQYVFEQFGIGKIIMSNGMEAIDSSLNYSLFDHKLYFIKNKGMYVVNQPVKSFQLKVVDNENNSLINVFSSGYSNVEDNNSTTFYEVIADGPLFQLLKYTSKHIKESTVYGSAPIKEYTTDHVFFVYVVADKKILLVGSILSLKNLKKTLSEKSVQLDQLISTLQLNLKKEEDVKQLFEKLN